MVRLASLQEILAREATGLEAARTVPLRRTAGSEVVP